MSKYYTSGRDKCPHCNTVVQFVSVNGIPNEINLIASNERISIQMLQCPSCGRIIIATQAQSTGEQQLLWPKSTGRTPVPPEVPTYIAQDYNEAALVLNDSPKASAALSRRCLQTVLREAGKTTKRDLNDQIDEIAPKLPEYIGSQLHSLRQIGNFAAHTQKSQITGAILDVEPGEAEWTLTILDDLFDHYYVRPIQEQKRKDQLNLKLKEAGKPPLI